MRLQLLTGLLATIISLHLTSARPQEEGYNYEVPENPLVISRPDDYDEPIESADDALADAQHGDGGGGGHGHHDHSGDPLDWLRDSIPGEPEVDYPIFAVAPESSFTCDEKLDGMYADVEARCQVWHQCFADRTWAFLCPNGTIFNQELFTCVWWFDFDCSTAESFYSLNADLYTGPTGGSNGDGGATGNGDVAATGNGGGDTGSDATSGLAPEVVEAKAPVEEAAPVINEPVILDPVIPEQPDLAPLPAEAPRLEPAPIAPEPQPQPTPSVDDLPLDDTYDYYEDDSDYEEDPEDEYDASDIPDDQKAPEGYGAPPPVEEYAEYELPDYEVPDYEAPAPDYEAPAPDYEVPAPVEEEEVVDYRAEEESSDVVEEIVEEEEAAPVEEGYNYPVPANPLELPEKSSQSELPDDSVAPLALYGAPAQPFELPPDTLPTAAPEELEDLPLAQYLPPATAPREARGRFGRRDRRGRRRGGQRRKRLIRTVRYL